MAPESEVITGENAGTAESESGPQENVSPPPYQSTSVIPGIRTSILDLPENAVLKAGVEGFNATLSTLPKKRRTLLCTRCRVSVSASEWQYGCQKCADWKAKNSICQKCYDADSFCHIDKAELVKTEVKEWPCVLGWWNVVDREVGKGDDNLVKAIKENDLERVKHFAKDKKLLNAHGDFVHLGYTPLHLAAHLGLEPVAKLLIENGCSLEPKDQARITPILTAIETNNIGIFKLLLDSGVSITSASGNNATTPLHMAASQGMDHVVTYALSQGVPVDLQSGRGTALQIAARVGSVKCVEVLLAAGADVNSKGGFFGAPLVSAATRTDGTSRELVEMLLKQGAEVDIKGGDDGDVHLRPLRVAVQANNKESVELLLQYGAAIDAQDSYGLTVLMRACALNHMDICKLLLDRRADIDFYGGEVTALSAVACHGNEEMIDFLLQKGASGLPPPSLGGKWKNLKKTQLFRKVAEDKRNRILTTLRAAKQRAKLTK